jgi:DNA polymerase-3 subunit chi
MAVVNFYHMTKNTLEEVLPRLLEKVIQNNHRAVVLVDNDAYLEELDKVLWTYTPLSFLPHGTTKDLAPELQPIFLTTTLINPNEADVLVLTSDMAVDDVSPFERCLDLFNGRNTESTEKARLRWKAYKDAGHTVTYWRQGDQGKWELQEG